MLNKLHFNTWSEYVDFCEHRKLATPNVEDSRDNRNTFCGGVTFDEALSLARTGWAEGTARIKTLSQVLTDKVYSCVEKPEIQYDVTGADWDIGALMQGAPECWYRYETVLEKSPGKVVHVVFNGTASGGVSTEVIEAKGAAISAFIECLELTGNKVSVDIVFYAGPTGPDNYQIVTVTLKQAGQTLDLDRLAFALAHPASLRRLTFAAYEAFPYGSSNGYGQPQEYPGEADIYIGCSTYEQPEWTDTKEATAWIFKQLRAQGVSIIG